MVAAFDFDGTITYYDSLRLFLRHFLGTKRFIQALFALAPTLIRFQLGLMKNDEAKQRALAYTLGGKQIEEIEEAGKVFGENFLPQIVRPKAAERIAWHKAQGHTLVLVSASIETYLIPWAKKMGFDAVCASQIEVQNGCATGNLCSRNCWGPEKVSRLSALLGDLNRYELYAYGDTRGDQELLACAQHPHYRMFH